LRTKRGNPAARRGVGGGVGWGWGICRMNRKILLRRLLSGHLNNVAFSDFIDLVEAFGFKHIYTKGSHHIYKHPEVDEALNLQSKKGEAKPYQIRQFTDLIELNDLHLKDDK
jgi:predicted RNA binding protein YcfA (HicA-like mRNA interferase family)